MSYHRSQYKAHMKNGSQNYVSSYDILKFADAYIELVEEIEYDDKKQLTEREAFYIRNNVCVNRNIPHQTIKERQVKNKEHIAMVSKKYHDEHKEELKEKRKIYVEENKEKIQEDFKEWAEKNKEKRQEYMRKWREANNDKLKGYQETRKNKDL